MSQQTEVDEPTLFPFPFSFHAAFVCIGVVFFVFRFLKLRQPYQIIMAAAMFCSLGIPLSEGNKKLFYLIGALEVVLLAAALVTSIVCRDPADEAAAAAEGGNGAETEEQPAAAEESADDSGDSTEISEEEGA